MMTISKHTKDLALLYWRRRWAMLFLNLVAGLFAAPLLYWGCIFMPVVLGAANDTPILLGLNALSAVGNLTLLLPAALGLGGCFSSMRRILAGEDTVLLRQLGQGIFRCARRSLLAGAVVGLALAAAQIGLAGLYAIPGTPAVLRGIILALLALQLFWAVSLGLGMLSRQDELRPLQALLAAVRNILAQPLQYAAGTAATLLPLVLLFAWQTPLPTFLGFLLIEIVLLSPLILLWQSQSRAAGYPLILQRQAVQDPKHKKSGILAVLGSFFAFDVFALLLPLIWRREFPTRVLVATLRQTVDFIVRQTLMEASNGTLREMLASSSVWPLLLVTLLGCACCVMAAYACACHSFRMRGLLFAGAAVLQVLPILSGYAGLELLLRGLFTGHSLLLGIAWIALYLSLLLMLYRNFHRQLPNLQKKKEVSPGVRLFFYYAVPRARYWIFALAAVSTLGCWNDAFAPFRYLQELGTFSLTGHVWEHAGGLERALGPVVFLLLLAFVLTILRYYAKIKKS